MGDEEAPYTVEYVDDAPEETNWLKREGMVKIGYPNGDSFEGFVDAGKLKQGRGKYIWVESSEEGPVEKAWYDGEYVNGKKEGLGKMKFPSGDTYHGMWKNDSMNGDGTYMYANGDIFSGTFVNGIKEGNGTYEYAEDKSQLTGNWKQARIIDGSWLLQDGTKYSGRFEDNLPIGPCVFTFSNGFQQGGEYTKVIPEDGAEGTGAKCKFVGGAVVRTMA